MNKLSDIKNLFSEIASAIAAKHLAQVRVKTARLGGRPPFDELMQELTQMEQELTREGILYLEGQHHLDSAEKEALTTSLKGIIRNTIESFVKQL